MFFFHYISTFVYFYQLIINDRGFYLLEIYPCGCCTGSTVNTMRPCNKKLAKNRQQKGLLYVKNLDRAPFSVNDNLWFSQEALYSVDLLHTIRWLIWILLFRIPIFSPFQNQMVKKVNIAVARSSFWSQLLVIDNLLKVDENSHRWVLIFFGHLPFT